MQGITSKSRFMVVILFDSGSSGLGYVSIHERGKLNYGWRTGPLDNHFQDAVKLFANFYPVSLDKARARVSLTFCEQQVFFTIKLGESFGNLLFRVKHKLYLIGIVPWVGSPSNRGNSGSPLVLSIHAHPSDNGRGVIGIDYPLSDNHPINRDRPFADDHRACHCAVVGLSGAHENPCEP